MNMSLIAGLSATAVLLGSVAVARAETTATAETSDAYRSPATASALSISGVAASGLAMLAGAAIGGDTGAGNAIAGAASLMVTPSIGQIYSGDYLSTGLIARLAGTAAMGLGGALLLDGGFDDEQGKVAVGLLLFVGGAAAAVSGVVLDVAFAGTAAERWNVKHGFTVAPTAIATPSGASAGLGFSGRF